MTKDDIYHSSFIYLLHRITNNLRFLFLDIKENEIKLISYFESPPSDLEKELIEDIGNEILAMTDKIYDDEYEYQVTNKPFDQIPKTDYLLYARYENEGG